MRNHRLEHPDKAELRALKALLAESLNHITDKPWDDSSCLHARISAALGRPVQYKTHLESMRANGFMDDKTQIAIYGEVKEVADEE